MRLGMRVIGGLLMGLERDVVGEGRRDGSSVGVDMAHLPRGQPIAQCEADTKEEDEEEREALHDFCARCDG